MRVHRGDTLEEIHAYGEEPDVRAAQSAPFGVQQCISALVHRDPHDVARIVALPELDGTPAFGQNEWVLEQLKRLLQDLNVPWLLALQRECQVAKQPDTCDAMHVGGDVYMCPAHGNGRPCTALEYVLHATDAASETLRSTTYFPPLAPVPPQSVRHFAGVSKQLARVFLHLYEHHRDLFVLCEAESSLYARFRRLAAEFDLYPAYELPEWNI